MLPGSLLPLQIFEPLSRIRKVRLFNLHKGASANPAARWSFAVLNPGPNLDEDGAFVDTAAIMQNLDLVITSDTSIAHLAGALGVPVWVVLPHAAEWRWLRQRPDSPWYPTMRLFRQLGRGDWPGQGIGTTDADSESLLFKTRSIWAREPDECTW